MLDIKVLSLGCEMSARLEQQVAAALEVLRREIPSLEATIQHVTEYDRVVKYPVSFVPTLMVNDRVVCTGRIPTVGEVTAWLRKALGSHSA